jgi:hypothetical protein
MWNFTFTYGNNPEKGIWKTVRAKKSNDCQKFSFRIVTSFEHQKNLWLYMQGCYVSLSLFCNFWSRLSKIIRYIDDKSYLIKRIFSFILKIKRRKKMQFFFNLVHIGFLRYSRGLSSWYVYPNTQTWILSLNGWYFSRHTWFFASFLSFNGKN